MADHAAKDQGPKNWMKALEADELPEGRVKSVSCANRTLCLTHFEGRYAALDNACPHQGGPLGEGSIENGLLRCPWHGWDYHPTTGKAPGFDDGVETFAIEGKGHEAPVTIREIEEMARLHILGIEADEHLTGPNGIWRDQPSPRDGQQVPRLHGENRELV